MTRSAPSKIALVTGGAGFIGSNIVAHLAAQNTWDVVVCDWLESGDKWRNLAKHRVSDVVLPEQLEAFLNRAGMAIDVIVHMGAITSTTEHNVDLLMKNNFMLSRHLWNWAAERGTRLIYASSAATYGDGSAGFKDDESAAALDRLKPLNPYGWSKHLFDQFVAAEVAGKRAQPKQWAGLKFFNVYGPNEYHKGNMKSVVAQIFPAASSGRPVRLFRSHHPDYADGGQLRDFVHVDDCVAVVDWLLQTPKVCGLFNMGTGLARSFADLARAVFASLNRKPSIEYIDTPEEIRSRYQYFTQADMAKLRAAGYERDFLSLEAGVADYVQNYLARQDPYR